MSIPKVTYCLIQFINDKVMEMENRFVVAGTTAGVGRGRGCGREAQDAGDGVLCVWTIWVTGIHTSGDTAQKEAHRCTHIHVHTHAHTHTSVRAKLVKSE